MKLEYRLAVLTGAGSSGGVTVLRAVEQGRARVRVGNDATIVALLERLAPVNCWRLLARRVPA